MSEKPAAKTKTAKPASQPQSAFDPVESQPASNVQSNRDSYRVRIVQAGGDWHAIDDDGMTMRKSVGPQGETKPGQELAELLYDASEIISASVDDNDTTIATIATKVLPD